MGWVVRALVFNLSLLWLRCKLLPEFDPQTARANMTASNLQTRAQILARMTVGTDETIHPDATLICTQNDYWVAWHDAIAAVLAPDTADSEPCDWVEGAQSLADLVLWIESGDYAQMGEFEGSDAEWDALCLDNEAHGHEHDASCGCHNH